MSVTTEATGSQVATVGTEHDLHDVAAAGTYLLNVDLSVLQAGDTVELRIYKIVVTGGTRRVAYGPPGGSFTGVQPTDDQIQISVPVTNALTDAGSLRFTLKQTGGVSRTFDWSVEKIG